PDPQVNARAAGTYELIVQLTAGNCLLKDTMILTVRNEQAPQFSIIDDVQICRGSFVNIGGGPGPGVNYAWTSSPPGFNSNANNPAVNPTEKTTYYVSATNAVCPLASIDSVVVDVSVPPVINVVADQNICEGDTVILANNIPSSSVSYQWNPGTALDFDTIPNPTAVPKTTTRYTLTATRGACEVMKSVNINVTEIEANIIRDSVGLCLGESANLNASIRPAGASSIWTPAEALSTTSGSSVMANPTDDITYYLEVTVPGCVRVDSVFVEVDSLPADLSIMPQDTTICQGSNVILVSPTYDPVYYPDIDFMWIPTTGQLTGDSLYNLVVQPNDTTTYSRITTNGACIDTSMTTVNVKPITVIMVDPANPTICQGGNVDLQITNTEMLEELEWMPATGLTCTDCLDPTASPQSTVQYMISAKVNGCPAQGTVAVNVLPDPSLPAVKGTVCKGTTISLNPGGNPAFTYAWSASPADPTLTDPTISSPVVTPTQNTTYTVTIDNGVCDPVTTAIEVEVVEDASLELTENLKICQGDATTLSAVGTGTGRYFWTVAGDERVIGIDPDLNVSPSTTTTYEVAYEYGPASRPCGTLTMRVTVTVLDNFDVEIQANPNATTISQGQEVTLSAITSPALTNATYVWTDQSGAEVGTGQNISVKPTNTPTASYTVIATSADGCTNSATISFTVIPPSFSIPNAFTPDGDGVNDIFRLIYSGNVELISFQIFDRRGSIVFETTNIDEGWDGTKNGKKMPSDVYVYLIRLNLPTGEEILKGDVTLIR
ncbi:MAG TPA: T9SS type B sorting domain-containing protein, partial [Saprospiraceae bacterium]|nr:T9SS type B sorting domain-containing protein [Saprospiraceae bacterium]